MLSAIPVLLSALISPAAQHLALEQEIFRSVDSGSGEEALRLWESATPAVVLGRSGVLERDVDETACATDGVEILRRDSGGGAVLVGPGCVNYALMLSLERRPELRDVRSSYRVILTWIVAALDVPGLEIRGLSDLAIGDRKVSGNAQRRGARALLHHGTLLCGLDTQLMERYLKPPPRQPDYRRGRSHGEFAGRLPLSSDEIIARLQAWYRGSGR
jgi:lipoate-protein ligase A